MQPNDVLIRRQMAVFSTAQSALETFTLHRFPSDEFIDGPWEDEPFARAKGLERGKIDGCDVWLEVAPGSQTYQLISR
jgi:hypothetical protein